MKLFKSIDDKFAEIGFTKVCEDPYGIEYHRYNEEYKYTHVIYLCHKENGHHLVQSYDKDRYDDIGNVGVGLTMYEMSLCLKKMKKKGWKMIKNNFS